MLFINVCAPEFFKFKKKKFQCYLEVKVFKKLNFSSKQTWAQITLSFRIQVFRSASIVVWPIDDFIFSQGQKVDYPVGRHDICYQTFCTSNIDPMKTFCQIKNLLCWFHKIAIRISYFSMLAFWLLETVIIHIVVPSHNQRNIFVKFCLNHMN